jgi:hypothetical protein
VGILRHDADSASFLFFATAPGLRSSFQCTVYLLFLAILGWYPGGDCMKSRAQTIGTTGSNGIISLDGIIDLNGIINLCNALRLLNSVCASTKSAVQNTPNAPIDLRDHFGRATRQPFAQHHSARSS